MNQLTDKWEGKIKSTALNSDFPGNFVSRPIDWLGLMECHDLADFSQKKGEKGIAINDRID